MKCRNGELDILRIVFAMTIVFYHFSCFYDINLYGNGGIAVEFFFFTTGALMTKSDGEVVTPHEKILGKLYSFMVRKIKSFYGFYLFIVLIQLLCDVYFQHLTFSKTIGKILYGIPNLLLLQVTGIQYYGGVDIGGSWYLSAMIISLFVLYPFCLKDKEISRNIIFPIIGFVGYYSLKYIATGDATSPDFYLARIIRGISGIAIGAWGKGLAEKLENIPFNKAGKVCLTVLKWFCLYMALGYGAYGLDSGYNALALMFCFFLLVLIFSNNTYSLKGNAITNMLGRLSLVLYLSHFIIISVAQQMMLNLSKTSVFLLIGICPVFAFAIMMAVEGIGKFFSKIKFWRLIRAD